MALIFVMAYNLNAVIRILIVLSVCVLLCSYLLKPYELMV